MKTDAKLRAGLAAYLPQTTKLIIAQRVASVQEADLILVMDNGRIVASGDHQALLGSCPIYQEIYAQQTGASDPEGGEADA